MYGTYGFVGFAALCLLTGCGSGGTSVPAGSLPLATGDQVLADALGKPLAVKLVRFETDYGTGRSGLVVTDEVLTLTSVDEASGDVTFRITVRGQTLNFVTGAGGVVATDSAGKDWTGYENSGGDYSATVGLYHYDFGGGAGDFDTEGFFVFGFATDPATIAAKTEALRYSGSFDGYGGVLDETGAIQEEESYGTGSIELFVDFDGMLLDGSLSGNYDGYGSISGSIDETSIAGNGFQTTFTPDCDFGRTCTSNTVIRGTFYGPDAEETSGLIAFDETVLDTATGTGDRLLSGAGFTLTGDAGPL
ncbi:hypothetical protein GQ651_07075 [Alphaproteobacteria bacterium GH1-50]|uniref:Transferrin-binding protein B C-lobe/N-lobe beta-barrel domain-containing protein n=1 Tax=Kangsaoukella pontilimi TaxID=2691042 RepID=A0A7C9IS40_9RHOB|nr:transferrin-binding protein-like solute binding protein [Kangsaoukella pontilimi]MXQ07605.1 hypothetical protein [Kangsaoukella pontilimi]